MKCIKCKKTIPNNSNFCNWCGEPQPKAHTEKKRRVRTRPAGSGTVYYDEKSKKWIAEKVFGYKLCADKDGKPKAKAIRARKKGLKTKAEALSYLDKLQDPREKRPTAKSATLKDLYDMWLPTWKASEATMEGYRCGFKLFMPVWYLPMDEQNIDDLQECLDSYEPKTGTTGKRMRQLAKTCLGLVYKYGMPRNLVPTNLAGEPNLSKFLVVRADAYAQKDGLTDFEVAKIKKAIGTVPYADYVYCACYLSFRPSAFLALKVSDYNKKERAFVGGIKTEAGIKRTVTVSPKIQPYVDALVKDKSPDDFVFHNISTQGQLLERPYREAFYNVLDAVGIDNPINDNMQHRLTPHSCRHTFATLMKAVDAPAKDKLALIGHTDETMLRRYQDVSYADLRAITDKL